MKCMPLKTAQRGKKVPQECNYKNTLKFFENIFSKQSWLVLNCKRINTFFDEIYEVQVLKDKCPTLQNKLSSEATQKQQK